MYPVVPVETMVSAIQFVCYFCTLLAAAWLLIAQGSHRTLEMERSSESATSAEMRRNGNVRHVRRALIMLSRRKSKEIGRRAFGQLPISG